MKLFLLFLLFIVSVNARNFGYNKDVRFANMLWEQMKRIKLVGSASISTHPYKGLPPHGAYVEMVESKLRVGRTNGYVIILKNYTSSNINIMHIINNPSSYLKSISVMFKRKYGYDNDNKNWFYVQYDASGMVMKSMQGFRLAGKIAKGSSTRGCISCHITAPGNDYVFSNDKLTSLKEPKMYKIRTKNKMRISAIRKKAHKTKIPQPENKMITKKSSTTYKEKDIKSMGKVPFGNQEDIMYAKQLWNNMQKSGLNSKPSNLYLGDGPHGKVREVVEGKINGKRVIVKRNYGGDDANIKSVSKNRAKYLKSITVMAKRHKGFDSKNADWFWVKYKANGSLHTNEKNIKLAGKIAKGSPKGCIACHSAGADKTLVFKHNKMVNAKIVFVKDFINKMDK